MDIRTTRFGTIETASDDFIHFPRGLLGMEDCRNWILLADAHNEAIAWLQSVDRADVALAMASPRRFVPGYRLRVTPGELANLRLDEGHAAYVLALVSRNDGRLTLNLKAPLVINLDRCLGRQVIVCDAQPLQYVLADQPSPLRKSA